MAYQEAKAVLYDEDISWAEQEEAVHTLEQLWEGRLTVRCLAAFSASLGTSLPVR